MPEPLPPIAAVATIDDVVNAIESIIQWSVANVSRLGYFAALYKRITIAIRAGIANHVFEDGPRMERFDVTFASRYFAALNAYFHPAQFPPLSSAWRIAFDGATHAEPILVQHMLAGVNAHIDLDLGIAAEEIAPGAQLASLEVDFNRVNAVLASQVSGVLDEIDSLSPVLADLYDFLQKYEMDLIDDGLKVFRDGAWNFATLLAAEPAFMHPATVMIQDAEVAKFGTLILYPPDPIAGFVAAIAARESRDVAHNIQVLDAIAATPAPLKASSL